MQNTADVSLNTRLAKILLVFFLCFLATLAIRFRTELFGPGSPRWNQPVDHWKYEYIAEHPIGSFHIQPTCWRIGVPLLTRLLPFSTYRDFDVLSIVFYGLTGGLIYLWLLAVPRSRDEAILGVLMFYSMGGAVKLVLEGVETPDPESYFFIVLALYAIYKGNDYLCALALALGMFTKETLAVAVPLHYSLKATRLWDSSRLKRSLLVAAPAVCIFVGFRLFIPAWNDHDDYVRSLSPIYTQVAFGDVRYTLHSAVQDVFRAYSGWSPINLLRAFTWGALGVQLFLPFFAIRENKNVLIRWAPYWIPIIGSLLIALNADRRLASLFPMLIVMGLNGISVLAARLDASMRDFQLIFLVQFALLLLKKDVGVVPFDLGAAAFLAGLCWLITRRSQPVKQTIDL